MTGESHDHGVLIPHRFNAYLEAYAREGWAIERADPAFKAFLVKDMPHSSRQENFILRPNAFWRPKSIREIDAPSVRDAGKFAAAPLVTRPPPVARLQRDARRASLSPGSGSGS